MSHAVLDRPAPVLDAPPVEEPPARPRLSEALREGCRYHPQGRTHLYNPGTGKTCALGALLVGLLGPDWTVVSPYRFDAGSIHGLIFEHTGVNLNQKVPPPEGLGFSILGRQSLSALIIRLNDGARWPRERIADWLESLGL